MTHITSKGRELANKLGPSIGWTRHISETCSLICRSATSYCRIQEEICNGHPACSNPGLPIETVNRLQARHEKWCDKREQQLERRLKELVDQLPTVDGQGIKLNVGGDPRGYTVKLFMPDGRYDTWGGAEEGLGVPGS